MITRLVVAREWAHRLFVSIVIVAAIAKDHVFDAVTRPAPAMAPAEAPQLLRPGAVPTPQQAKPAAAPVHPVPAAPPSDPLGLYVEIAYVMALILIYASIEVVVELSVDHFRWVRRILMGRDDIEGYWLNIVFHSDQVLSGGLIYIYYEDHAYKVEGRDFGESGVWQGWFATDLTRFEERRLSYKYTSLRPGVAEDGSGHGEYVFTGGGHHHLTQFDGFFFEDRNPRRFYVHGERLEDFTKKGDLRQVMDAVNVPVLVATFIKERKAAMPIAPVIDPTVNLGARGDAASPSKPHSKGNGERGGQTPPAGG